MSAETLSNSRTDRFLAPDSRTARSIARAREVLPGGTSRHHYLFAPWPIIASRGKGCRVTDIEGDERIDCLNNMTALIHGHADPDVNRAIVAQVERGVSFSEPAEPEFALARGARRPRALGGAGALPLIRHRGSDDGHQAGPRLHRPLGDRQVRGQLPRLLRLCADQHHIHGENWGAASAPNPVPSSGGLSAHVSDDVVVLPFNDPDGVERLLAAHGHRISALLVEPLSNRNGMVLPIAGFYDFLREATRRYGIVLIFDEVIAFRVGSAGAQGRYGGEPDLTTFGKIIGGGLPIGAVGGSAEIMALLDPANGGAKVTSGGTYSGNPLAAAAGLATLAKLTPGEYARLDALGARMRNGANAILRAAGQVAQVSGDASLFQVVPTDAVLVKYRSIPRAAAANAWLDRLHRGLLVNGMIISHRGLSCVSTAMTEADVDRCLEAFEAAIAGLEN